MRPGLSQITPNAREKHMWREMSESWLGVIGHAEREDFARRRTRARHEPAEVNVVPLGRLHYSSFQAHSFWQRQGA